LVLLLCRSNHSKELEILVLPQNLAILRPGTRGERRFDPQIGRSLAEFARELPGSEWPSLSVPPATPLRWHRKLVRRRWTYPHSRPGRTALDGRVRTLVVRLAREDPRLPADRRQTAQPWHLRFADLGAGDPALRHAWGAQNSAGPAKLPICREIVFVHPTRREYWGAS
jgi:hypothetical protein